MTPEKKSLRSSIFWIIIGILITFNTVSNFKMLRAHQEKKEAIEQQTKEVKELNRLIKKHFSDRP